MNGFADHGLDEGAFGEKTGNIVKAFDAFREFSFPFPWWPMGSDIGHKMRSVFKSPTHNYFNK
jgi:hypothetical protein